MDNRRLLLAAVLSTLVVILWSYFFPPAQIPTPTPPPDTEAIATPSESPLEESAVDSSSQEPIAGAGPADGEVAPTSLEPVIGEMEEEVVLESETARVVISTLGAQMVSFELKHQDGSTEGALEEMVRARGEDLYPFALVLEGERSHPLNQQLFTWEDDGEGWVFRHRSEAGSAEKRFRWTEDGLLAVDIHVAGKVSWGTIVGPGVRNLETTEAENRMLRPMVGYSRGETSETIASRSLKEARFIPGSALDWVTLEDNYFLWALIPEQGLDEVIIRPVLERAEVLEGQPRFIPYRKDVEEEAKREQLLLLQAAGEDLSLRAMIGPKEYDRLRSLPYGLEETVRWGMFGFLARPLYYGLKWIYQNLVPNYGWAIVIMTFLIRLVFTPLTHKSQKSMQKMQELNPKVQGVRSKYRSKLKDRQGRPNIEAQQQMNQEMMEIYKKAGVNPASGCLPILLQIPVFFAFFRLLSTAVELRGAPWLGWIQDLAKPDPIWILPLLMGGTSVLVQRMTPMTTMDPMQRRILQFFPVMFTFAAIGFPSGLVLYWLTNNLLTMLHNQLFLKRPQGTQAVAQ